MMCGLIGRIEAQEGQAEQLATILSECSRNIPGCLSYIVALDPAETRPAGGLGL